MACAIATAARAAVSARRIRGPSAAELKAGRQQGVGLAGSKPPAGPTSSSSGALAGDAPRRAAGGRGSRAARRAHRRRAASRPRGSRWARSAAPPRARTARPRRRRRGPNAPCGCRAGPGARPRRCGSSPPARSPVTPSSVAFWMTSSMRSPLRGETASTRWSGGLGSWLGAVPEPADTVRRETSSRPPRTRARAVEDADRRARPQAEHLAGVVGACSGSSTRPPARRRARGSGRRSGQGPSA